MQSMASFTFSVTCVRYRFSIMDECMYLHEQLKMPRNSLNAVIWLDGKAEVSTKI